MNQPETPEPPPLTDRERLPYTLCIEQGKPRLGEWDYPRMMKCLLARHDALQSTVDRLTQQLQAATEAGVGWVPVENIRPQDHDIALHVLLPNNEVGMATYFGPAEASYYDDDLTPGWFGWDGDVHLRLDPQPTHYHPEPKPPRPTATLEPACPTGCDRCEGRRECQQETEGGGVL